MVGEVGRDSLLTSKKIEEAGNKIERRGAIQGLGLLAVGLLGWCGLGSWVINLLQRDRAEYGPKVDYQEVKPGDRLMIQLGSTENDWRIKPINYNDRHGRWADTEIERLRLRDENSRIRIKDDGVIIYEPLEFEPGARTVRHTAEILSLRAEKLTLAERVNSIGVYPRAGDRVSLSRTRMNSGEVFWGLPVILTSYDRNFPYEENRHYIGPRDSGPEIQRFSKGYAVIEEYRDEIRVMGYCYDEGTLKPAG